VTGESEHEVKHVNISVITLNHTRQSLNYSTR